jgi:hypothetical protein
MYDTSVICTYNTPEVFLETDEILDDERQFIRDVIYRQELLNIFGLEEYNKELFSDKITELYDLIKDNDDLQKCMIELAGQLDNTDKTIGLLIMFSYDFMYLSHKCISELLGVGHISEPSLKKLESNIYTKSIFEKDGVKDLYQIHL